MTKSTQTERAALLQQLTEAERAVAEGQAHVLRQEAIIAQLDRNGHDTTEARLLLVAMQNAQALDVRDRDRTSAELKGEEMTRPWTEADLSRLRKMVRQKASSADMARSLGRRVGSVKAKVREMGLVPLKKSPAKIPEA